MTSERKLVGKRVNYAAREALREALSLSWWYRDDLERFVRTYVSQHEIVARLNFNETKRDVAAQLTEMLTADEHYLGTVLDVMAELTALDDSFPHLARLEDGKSKVAAARAAQATLRKQYEAHAGLVADKHAASVRREEARRHAESLQESRMQVERLKKRFEEMIRLPHQERGYKLQPLLHELFVLFDLDPKASFAISGEQIDGAFSFDGDDFLVEARWQNEQADPAALRDFAGKIDTKLKTTLGVFVSINGFTEAAVANHSHKGANMVLVDGEDLYAILDGRDKLPDVLRRKRRHASQTGDIYLRVRDF